MDRNRKFEAPKPVSQGDRITVSIESQSGQGDGIAKVDGFIIFVKDGMKGETCDVKITEVKRTFATAEKVGNTQKSYKDSLDSEKDEMYDEVEGNKDGPAG